MKKVQCFGIIMLLCLLLGMTIPQSNVEAATTSWVGSSSYGWYANHSAALEEVKSVMVNQTSAYKMNRFNLILSEFPLSGYFNAYKTSGCSWHCGSCGKRDVNGCINSFYDSETQSTISLSAWQCYGYARYCSYRFFGSTLAGSGVTISSSNLSSSSNFKSFLASYDDLTGAHFRVNGSHSLVYLARTDSYIYFIDANSGYGSSTGCASGYCSNNSSHYSTCCKINLRRFTYSEFINRYDSLVMYYQDSVSTTSVSHGYSGYSDTITDTNAIVYGTVNKPSASVANKFGIRIRRTDGTYANGWSLYHASSKDYVGTSSIRIYFNMNEELGLTLTHATSYTYQLYAQVGGSEYWSSEKSFTTTGAHSYGSWTTVSGATCTTAGSQKRTCACGSYETQSISALGHNYSTAWTVDSAATCTVAGSMSHHCTRCGAKSSVTSIAATGHSYGSWQTTVGATCMTNGSQKRTCHCGSYETQTINATGHSYGSWTTTKAANCTELGVQKKTCSTCGTSAMQNLPALGHNYSVEWTVDKSATCTEAGSKSHHCTRCSAAIDNTGISALGHSWSDWAVVSLATTEKEGSKERLCRRDGCAEKETAVIAKLAVDGHEHKFGEWKITEDAACTKDGKSERLCETCKVTETVTISATGHTFGEWLTVKEATADDEGLLERSCSNCGEKESKIVSKLPATLPPNTPTPDNSDTEVTAEATPSPTELSSSKSGEKQENQKNNNIVWIIVAVIISLLVIMAIAGYLSGGIIKQKK